MDSGIIEDAIYEAAIVPERWPHLLGEISTMIGADGGVFFGVSETISWTSSDAIRERMQTFVRDGWTGRNARMQRGMGLGLHLSPKFVCEEDYGPGIGEEAVYTDFFYPNRLGCSAGTIAALPHDDLLCISFEQSVEKGPVSLPSLTLLDGLRPHLMRASLMTARLGIERVRTAVETLGALGLPSAAVMSSGRIIEANALFAGADDVWTSRGANRIALLDPVADGMLSEALGALVEASNMPHSIPVRRTPDGAMRSVVHIIPLRGVALDVFGSMAAVLVLSEPSVGAPAASLLLSVFDLTSAELDIARAVAAGMTVGDIARARGRSVTTIRNQLRSVLNKTGCNRQAELILLMRSVA